jgi:hypothetical protein
VHSHGGCTNGGCIMLKFSPKRFPNVAKHKAKLVGWALYVQTTHRNMHGDVYVSARCSSHVAKHKANLVGLAFCDQTHIGHCTAPCICLMCFSSQSTKPAQFGLCFVAFEEHLMLNFRMAVYCPTSF